MGASSVYVLFGLTLYMSGTTLTIIIANLIPRYVAFMSHNHPVHPGEYLHGTKGLAILFTPSPSWFMTVLANICSDLYHM